MIDRRLFDFVNKIVDDPEVIIENNDQYYAVNVMKCMQYCLSDRN